MRGPESRLPRGWSLRLVAGAAIAATVIGLACRDTAPTAPGEGGYLGVPLALDVRIVGLESQADRTLQINVFYRRMNGDRITLPSKPQSISLANGTTQQIPIEVNIAPCLADQQREGAGEIGCRLMVEARLVDESGGTVDQATSDPQQLSPPWGLIPVPALTLSGAGIGLNPTSLDFTAEPGAALPAARPVTVRNSGGGNLGALTAAVVLPTGMPSFLSATLDASSNTLTVRPTTTNLPVGTYTATVRVSSSLSRVAPQDLTVRYAVSRVPAIEVSRTEVPISATEGGANPSAETVNITNSGGGSLGTLSADVSFTDGTGWLAAVIDPATGVMTLRATTGTLASGTYRARVTISSSIVGVTPRQVNVTFTVNPGAVASVTLTLSPSTVQVAGTSTATAVPRDARGNPLAGRTVTFTVSDPNVAQLSSATSVSTAAGAATTLTGLTVGGPITVTATSEGQRATASLTVIPGAPASIIVTLNSPVLAIGELTGVTAVVRDARGAPIAGQSVTFSASPTSVAQVAGTGALTGMVTAVAKGRATITATLVGNPSVTGSATLTVTPLPPASIAVTLNSKVLKFGENTAATAVVRDKNGAPLDGYTVTWSSSNPRVAFVSSTGPLSAVVTAVASGIATITATLDESATPSGGPASASRSSASAAAPISGSADVQVQVGPPIIISVTVAQPTLRFGQTTTATAVVTDALGKVLDETVLWNVTQPDVIQTSNPQPRSASVTAVGPGSAAVVAVLASNTAIAGTAPVTVLLDSLRLSVRVAGSGSGTVTTSPTGITCVATAGTPSGTCENGFGRKSRVALTATPAAGSIFAGWVGEGCEGAVTCTVTMTQARQVTAIFTRIFTLTVSGGASSGSGRVTSSAAGVNAGIDCSIVVTTTTGTCAASYILDTQVTLTAVADANSAFLGWSGEGCSGTGTCTVGMGQARNVTATFARTFTLRITGSGSGTSGRIVSVPAGIDCAINASGQVAASGCVATFNTGTSVRLQDNSGRPAAYPQPVMHLTGGGCGDVVRGCTVTVDQDRAVTATFENPASLQVNGSGTGSGTVTSSPAGVNCTITRGQPGASGCGASFEYRDQVTLTAAAASGSTFNGWSGACAGTGTCVVTMDQARTVTAIFTGPGQPLNVTMFGSGTATVTSSPSGINCVLNSGVSSGTCSASYAFLTTVTLTASPTGGSVFLGWSGEGCSGTGTCTVTMDQARNVTANFRGPPQTLTVAGAGTGSGSVTSSPAGINCSVASATASGTCSAGFDFGSSVTLTATAASGSTFAGWSGACTGTGTCTVTMDQARNVTATFTGPPQSVTVNAAGTGDGTVTSSPAGINCTISGGRASGTCSATFPLNASVTLTATPASGHVFVGWSGDCTGTGTCTVTVDQARNVTATIEGPRTLDVTLAGSGNGTVTSSPAGINCTISGGISSGTCRASFAFNTQVTLTATPGAGGHTFTGWGADCVSAGTATSCQLAMAQNRSAVANFRGPGQTLTVAGAGTGSGTVTSNPAGVNCTVASGSTSGTCSASFDFASSVTLTATAAGGSTFTGWSGACTGTGTCTVTMDQARGVTATFTGPPQSVTVTGSGTGNGTVTSSPAGINCTITAGAASGTCSSSFPLNTSVTLTATAASGHSFLGWSGDCTGTGTCTVTVNQARNVTARFEAPQTLTVAGAGTGAGTITSSPAGINCTSNNGATSGTCSTSFPFGTSVTLTATPNSGQTFGGWTGACSGTGTCTVTMDQARSVTASFTGAGQPLSVTMFGTGTATVTSNPSGINCSLANGVSSGTCSAGYPFQSTVTLTASPSGGTTFTGWSGDCTGTGTCTVTMNQARNVTANFQGPAQTLTVAGAGTGAGTVTSSPAGINCTSNNSATSGTCSSSFAFGTVVTLTATANSGQTFTGWSGACSGTGTCQVTMDQARGVTASFSGAGQALSVTMFGSGSATVTSSPTGISCTLTNGVSGGTCGSTFPFRSSVTLTATPGSGTTFTGWSGDCTGTGTCTVTMDQARNVTANFQGPAQTLTVAGSGSGIGTVTSSPAGINCTSDNAATSGTCSASYGFGTVVTLTATPSSGHTFTGWSGACTGTGTCQVTMDQARSVTAGFSGPNQTLSVTMFGGGTATVTSSPSGISCSLNNGVSSGTCSTSFPFRSSVTLTATPTGGTTFTGWSGACTNTTGTCTVTMDQARNVTANFQGPSQTLTVTGTGSGTGTVTSSPAGINCTLTSGAGSGACSASYAFGTAVTLTATPGSGQTFGGWSGACSGTGTCTVTMDQVRNAIAAFDVGQQRLTVSASGRGSGTVTSSPAGINCTIASGTTSGACSVLFDAGTSVTLNQSASSASTFGGWSGDCTGTGACTVTMNQARSVTVTFSGPTFTVTTGTINAVTGGGRGDGTVTSTPAGLNCTIANNTITGSCSAEFAPGTSLTVTVAPASGQYGVKAATFPNPTTTGMTCTNTNVGTSPNDAFRVQCTGNLNADATLSVQLNRSFLQASFSSANDGNGRVTSDVGNIDCQYQSGTISGVCGADVTPGSNETLFAVVSNGSVFTGWSGGSTALCNGSTSTSCAFTMDRTRYIFLANFRAGRTLTVSGPGSAVPNGSGTVTSGGGEINCTITDGVAASSGCSTTFASNASVTLTATPTSGHTFAGWSGDCTNTTGTCTVSMTQARSVTATFTGPSPTLSLTMFGSGSATVTSSPSGISCSLAGGVSSGTCSTSYPYRTSVTLTATPGSGTSFTGWSGACTNTTGTCTVTMDQARSVTANFQASQRTLTVTATGRGNGTVTSSPSGINCTVTGGTTSGTCSAPFDNGTAVRLTETIGTGSTFGGWSGDCTGTGSTCDVVMDQARTANANFAGPTFTVVAQTLRSNPGFGNGTVTSSPAGLNCTITNNSTSGCSAEFAPGTSLTVTVAPVSGQYGVSVFSFPPATGMSCSLTSVGSGVNFANGTRCTGNLNASATLRVQMNRTLLQGITPISSSAGNGRVTSNVGGVDCTYSGTATSGICDADIAPGTSVTLTAAPSSGNLFTRWSSATSGSGVCDGSTVPTCAFTMDRTYYEFFPQFAAGFALTVSGPGSAVPNGSGTVTSGGGEINCTITDGVAASSGCSATFASSASVTLTATPTSGHTFAGWSGDCTNTTGTCTVSMTQARNVTATFTGPTQRLSVSGAGGGTGSVAGDVSPNIACNWNGATSVQSGTCQATYPYRTVVTLTATASSSPASAFTGWSGACTNSSGTCQVTMSTTRSVTATFQRTFTLDVFAASGRSGDGTVTSTSPSSLINCSISGTSRSGTCTGSVVSGTSVTLSESPGSGSTFGGWSFCPAAGAPPSTCTFTVTQDTSITAAFNGPLRTLAVTTAGGGGGTVTSNPSGINCSRSASVQSGTCSAQFNNTVTLTATRNSGDVFSGWGGDCASFGTSTTCTLTMSAARNVTATFNGGEENEDSGEPVVESVTPPRVPAWLATSGRVRRLEAKRGAW